MAKFEDVRLDSPNGSPDVKDKSKEKKMVPISILPL